MTRIFTCRCWLSVACLLMATTAWGQYWGGGVGPYYGYGGYGGFGYGGAGTTVAGSYMSGMANAIRAEGQYNLLTAQAANELADARKKEIENKVEWTNAYFELRKINQAYQQSQRRPRPPQPESWVRAAHVAEPDRLNASQLDPVTGKINWPAALSGPDYAEFRQSLDDQFSHRAATHGAIGDEGHARIQETVNAALEVLRSKIRELPPQTYIDARKFLLALTNEASHPPAGSML